MKLQNDFATERTLLQFHGHKLGVMIDRTPKCHPEIAGEGIEYRSALAKCHYRRSPINKRRTKEKIRGLVLESTNSSSILNIDRVRSCSKKARSYMKLYTSMESIEIDNGLMSEKHSIMEEAIKNIRSLKKLEEPTVVYLI